MPVRGDLGHRVELVSMDPHCGDISVGLYRRDTPSGPVGVVHSYSTRPGTTERLDSIRDALVLLGGLERVDADPDPAVRLPCRSWHNAAMKRLFLDCFRIEPHVPPAPRPLEAPDPRSSQLIRIVPLGGGVYRVESTGGEEGEPSRATAIARALVRLVELDAVDETTVAFACGSDHHELMGLMLVRAQNLRAALREEELTAGRGVLAAPAARE
jgi:hypothetical protein